MVYLEVIAKIVMQIEDLAHLCLFIAEISRKDNSFYFSTNEEIVHFFSDDKFISHNYIKKYMGLDFKLSSLNINKKEEKELENILIGILDKYRDLMVNITEFRKENYPLAKSYLHGIPSLNLQEARDIQPVGDTVFPEEKEIRKRPKDFLVLLINNTKNQRVFHTVEHTPKGVKDLLKLSNGIKCIITAFAFSELSKLDYTLNKSLYIYFYEHWISQKNIMLLKKYFVLPWSD